MRPIHLIFYHCPFARTFALGLLLVLAKQSGHSDPVQLVPFHQVRMEDQTWRPRIKELVGKTLPHALKQTEVAQVRLRLCAEWLESGGKTQKPAPHRFNTSDLYKVLEGAALMIQSEPNKEIELQIDRITDVIARAQKKDGYLYISHIVGNPWIQEMGPRPYSHVIHSHELYNVGHLYEAAVAYAQATGKTKLLEIAEKSALHVNKVIFEGGDPAYNAGQPVNQAPGHQEIELGLVKLHNYTGKAIYLEMAKKFLDIRGVTFVPDGTGVNSPSYAQQHKPVAAQRKPAGHAVRATYQYAAMAEVDSLLGTKDFSTALDSIWANITDTRMHITGGLGAVHGIEGFGAEYELPNKHTYLETCAAVGNVFFNMRMFLKYKSAKYVDVAEVALLNNCLAGIGLNGTSFFYPNPLEAETGHSPRSGWFGTACCPSNIARLIPQVSGYMYATGSNQLFCLLYGSNTAKVRLGGNTITLRQVTDYPHDGNVAIHLDPADEMEFVVSLRIPTWTGQQFVPGKLYNYVNDSPAWEVTINGERHTTASEDGFLHVRRIWRKGDAIAIRLPMPVRANRSLDAVKSNRGRVAISRGPLVYCAEEIDNHGAVQRFYINPKVTVNAVAQPIEKDGLMKGLPGIEIPATERTFEGEKSSSIKLVPYFSWSNRDRGSMITWLPTNRDLAQPDLRDSKHFKFSGVSASHTFEKDTADALRMRTQPKSSADTSIPRWTSWPQKGKAQWCEIDLGKPSTIKSFSIYFYDDQGGVQVPGKWHLESLDAGTWKEVILYNTDAYSVLPDNYNKVHPQEELKTRKLRIVMKPQHGETCVGILSVEVETVE